MENVENDKKTESEVEVPFAKMLATFTGTQNVRTKIQDKLLETLDKIKIDPDEKALQTQAKISIIHKLAEIVNDMDSQVISEEKLKMAKKDNDLNANTNKIIAEFLYQIKDGLQVTLKDSNSSQQIEQTDEDIDKIIDAQGIDILPGEIV